MTFEKWLKLLMAGGGAATVAMDPEEARALNAGPLAKKFRPQFSSLMDKKPRMEISDMGMKFKVEPEYNKYYKLGDLIDHPELFENYPELKNVYVHVGGKQGQKGTAEYYQMGPEEYIVTASHGRDLDKQTLIHEIQHAIQEREGFARGGSPSSTTWASSSQRPELLKTAQKVFNEWKPAPYEEFWGSAEKTKEGIAAYQKYLDKFNSKESAAERWRIAQESAPERVYQNLAGEIEARDVADRAGLSAEERLRRAHYSPQGIPLEDAIVRYRAASQALQEPWFDPVSMFTSTFGVPGIAGKVAAAALDPIINYVTETKPGGEDAADILIGRTPAEKLERYRYKRR